MTDVQHSPMVLPAFITKMNATAASKENKQRKAKINRFLIKLNALAVQADDLELVLPNGGIVGNMIGGIVEDVIQVEEVSPKF
jgi:hypothetical protein